MGAKKRKNGRVQDTDKEQSAFLQDSKGRIQEMLYILKGDRTLREFGADTDVSYSNIQRLLHGQYLPGPDTIDKLTHGDRNPQGDITYEELMTAAGYMSDPPKAGIDRLTQRLEAQNQRHEDATRIISIKKVTLILYGALVQKRIKFDLMEMKEPAEYYLSPDLLIELEDQANGFWVFHYYMSSLGDLEQDAKAVLSQVMLIAPNPSRKISIVTDDTTYYDDLISFKGRNAFKGDLSIVLLDLNKLDVLKEDYISHFEDEGQEFLLV